MKNPAAKPSLAALLADKKSRLKAKRGMTAPSPNAALNVQNRRVLAQHYRAKYGVK